MIDNPLPPGFDYGGKPAMVSSICSDLEPGSSRRELTLRALRIFMAVEESGSIGGAAASIDGSPSGVSQQITALEAAVGTKLVDRTVRPLTLTPAGHVLKTHAKRILDAVAEAQAELQELNLVDLKELTLAILDDLDASLTPILVSHLQRHFRHCFINVYSGRSDNIIEKLVAREASIAVASVLPEDGSRFLSLPILREPFILVAARGAIDREQDMHEQLRNRPFVQYSKAMPIGRLVAQHLGRLRFNAVSKYSFEASRSVFAMVVHDKGWTLTTPLNLIDAERYLPHIEIWPLPFPALSRTVYLVSRSGELGRLPEHLAEDCRRLLEKHIVTRFTEIAPHMAGAIEILNAELPQIKRQA